MIPNYRSTSIVNPGFIHPSWLISGGWITAGLIFPLLVSFHCCFPAGFVCKCGARSLMIHHHFPHRQGPWVLGGIPDRHGETQIPNCWSQKMCSYPPVCRKNMTQRYITRGYILMKKYPRFRHTKMSMIYWISPMSPYFFFCCWFNPLLTLRSFFIMHDVLT